MLYARSSIIRYLKISNMILISTFQHDKIMGLLSPLHPKIHPLPRSLPCPFPTPYSDSEIMSALYLLDAVGKRYHSRNTAIKWRAIRITVGRGKSAWARECWWPQRLGAKGCSVQTSFMFTRGKNLSLRKQCKTIFSPRKADRKKAIISRQAVFYRMLKLNNAKLKSNMYR